MNVRATVERLGREHVGKSWWADLSEALVAEFEPVVAERDALDGIVSAYHDATGCMPDDAAALRAERDRYRDALRQIKNNPWAWPSSQSIARAALDREEAPNG